MPGLLLLKKPKNTPSRLLVNQILNLYPKEKVGHAGTLDPLAEGLLIIGVGKDFTKKLTDLQKIRKKNKLLVLI